MARRPNHLGSSLLWLLTAACAQAPEPAPAEIPPTALRRLTRAEYDATVRDLLHTSLRPGVDLPADDLAEGFDRVAAALSTSPLHVELYEQAAGAVVREAMRAPLEAPVDEQIAGSSLVAPEAVGGPSGSGFTLWSQGAATWAWPTPKSGRYRLSARLSGQQAGPDPVLASLLADEDLAATFEVQDDPSTSSWYTTELDLREGTTALQISFDNDYFNDEGELVEDRNLIVHELRVEGPLQFVYTPNPSYEHVMRCDLDGPDPRGCARSILSTLAPRAWRRPVESVEIDRLMARYDEVLALGDPPAWGLEFTLRALLTSPNFVFLVERDATDGLLDPYALASRLSYFLWSSMPDDELLALAADGTLHDPAVLAAQAERMLRDPRAEALVTGFASQWLHINALDDATPDPAVFTTFDEALRAGMRAEMEATFRSFIGKDRDLRELLTNERIYVDNALATFYGIDQQRGEGEVWSYLGAEVGRGGWLSTAGLLTALSYPTRTSPVRRGVWVLDALLCSPAAAPPPGVEGLPAESADATTLRERLEQHRADPSCASCHDSIDPVGFAFEHFDGIGAWREIDDDGGPIDPSGTLPDGTAIDDLADLATTLARDPRFTRCMARKAFIYSHGRKPSAAEVRHLDAAHDRFVAEGATLDALVTALITSPTFLAPLEAP
jgi:hypothetical protein